MTEVCVLKKLTPCHGSFLFFFCSLLFPFSIYFSLLSLFWCLICDKGWGQPASFWFQFWDVGFVSPVVGSGLFSFHSQQAWPLLTFSSHWIDPSKTKKKEREKKAKLWSMKVCWRLVLQWGLRGMPVLTVSLPAICSQCTPESYLSTSAVLHGTSCSAVQHSNHHLSSFHNYKYVDNKYNFSTI